MPLEKGVCKGCQPSLLPYADKPLHPSMVTCRTTTCYVCVSHYFVIHLFSFPLCTLCYCLFATYFHTYTNRGETIVTSFFIIALGESNPSAVFELFQFLLTILMDVFATVENRSKLETLFDKEILSYCNNCYRGNPLETCSKHTFHEETKMYKKFLCVF